MKKKSSNQSLINRFINLIKMSSNNMNNDNTNYSDTLITKEVSNNKVNDTKPASSLPAKHFKSLAFGYWMLLKVKNDGIIDEPTFNNIVKDYLHLYSSIPLQIDCYESFDNDFKMVSKDLKKLIKDFSKPSKPPKPPKLSKPISKRGRPHINNDNNDNNENHNDDLISSIVHAALHSTHTRTYSKP